MTTRAWPSLALALACAGCPTSSSVPGRQLLGTYAITTEALSRDCAIAEVLGEPFSFEATFSRNPDTGDAWLTLQGTTRAGAWDGQVFRSTAEARRIFPLTCGECATSLEETLDVALLSQSQSAAAGDQCPESALDGGLPEGLGNVRPPRETAFGMDAVRACGELATRVHAGTLPDGGACPPECDTCRVRYRVRGARK